MLLTMVYVWFLSHESDNKNIDLSTEWGDKCFHRISNETAMPMAASSAQR